MIFKKERKKKEKRKKTHFYFWLEMKDKHSLVLPPFSKQCGEWNTLMCVQKKTVPMGQAADRRGGGAGGKINSL